MPVRTPVFDLPDRLTGKADPALVGADETHFAALADALEQTIAELSDRLAVERLSPGGSGQEALDRDLQIHRLTARLRLLRRFGLDICLGRMVGSGADDPVYVGRLGLTDRAGRRLLVDWRSPAAEPFFAATFAHPMGLASRRRYRWVGGRITDYWDEVFSAADWDTGTGRAALDDQSAFLASLGANRSSRMRDVLSTIQADQDAIIRAGSRGALVVDGGPGTGKTVVALHRAAYLLYSDPRIGAHQHGGVLFIGPHQTYLAYVADILPALGEEGVRTCTLRNLVPEGADAVSETEPGVARLKSSVELVDAVERAVRFYEQPPERSQLVSTEWSDLTVTPDDWERAFDAAEPGTPHNEARDAIWDELVAVLLETDTGVPPDELRVGLRADAGLRAALDRAWPLLDPAELVGDLWTVPAFLRHCAPGLTIDEVRLLQRAEATAWTIADLPLLDAARHLLGDPETSARRRRREAAMARQRAVMDRVVDELIAADDSELGLMKSLRGQDAQHSLLDEPGLPTALRDVLAGPFAHVVVDEAQELTDAEWRMVLRRCPSRSVTVVGDRAQARHGFAESWQERLARIGLNRVAQSTLRINYRTPAEIMAEAEPVIRAVLPDANVPLSVRTTGLPVLHTVRSQLQPVLADWLSSHGEGIACVLAGSAADLADAEDGVVGVGGAASRVRVLSPELAKGLEFDLVVLLDDAIESVVDRYVAMTRATEQLVVLSGSRPTRRSPQQDGHSG